MGSLSGFLYARPSVVEGVSRILDLGNTLHEYNYSLSSQHADYLALTSDWMAVGRDIHEVMLKFEESFAQELGSKH